SGGSRIRAAWRCNRSGAGSLWRCGTFDGRRAAKQFLLGGGPEQNRSVGDCSLPVRRPPSKRCATLDSRGACAMEATDSPFASRHFSIGGPAPGGAQRQAKCPSRTCAVLVDRCDGIVDDIAGAGREHMEETMRRSVAFLLTCGLAS